MRYLTYEDENGKKWRVAVRDNDPDTFAKFGVPAGPPDIELIDWDALKMQVHDVLFKMGVYTRKDLQGSGVGLVAALNVFKRHLIALYKSSSNLDDVTKD
jgi:hypothetical protein